MKICPRCNCNHIKPGIYCSRKCANVRNHSDETKNKMSLALKGKPSPLKGRPGLAHSDESKQKISEAVKNSMTDERREQLSNFAKNRIKSVEEKRKLSIAAKKNGFGGHNSKQKLFFQKKDGKVVYLQSSYEIDFAVLLEEMNIAWDRPEPFVWIDENGIDHKYYPDFKVGNIFIDTKNDYLAIIDLPKINAVKKQNNIDLRIVTKDLINKEYIASLV